MRYATLSQDHHVDRGWCYVHHVMTHVKGRYQLPATSFVVTKLGVSSVVQRLPSAGHHSSYAALAWTVTSHAN